MRKPRIVKVGAAYHITGKINRSEHIFEPNAVKNLFLDTVKRAKNKYKFKLYNFCVMENHIHMVVKPGKKEKLSNIMRWIFSVFAIYYNKANGLKGHVWQDRFHSVLIEEKQHMIAAFSYVRDNPLKAGMVNDTSSYPFGGVFYILKKDFSIIDPPLAYLRPFVY